MRVRDLGAVAVAVDADERPVAGLRATAMLALLTINVNRRVSVDALMDAAWGEHLTPGAASSLDSHIWRLRQLLEPGRSPRQPPTVLVNDAGGYRLVAGAHGVDSLLFSELAGEVRDLIAAGHASAAVVRADKALGLWRGRPYGPLAERPWAQPAVARLDELHGQVEARRIEALVESGALDQALSDVEPLIAAMPFREPLRAQQMLALYRSGRGEQALQSYRDAHRLFMQEVGTEPGAELRTLHRRILDDDAGLAPAVPARRAAATAHTPEVHLPTALTPLIGREDALPALEELVRERRLVTVAGAAGCGKTRLAIEVARHAAPAFGDGVWFVDLASVPDDALVVETVVSTVGFSVRAGSTPLEDLGDYLRARRVLLVLDNCEHVLPSVTRIVEAALADGVDPGAPPACGILTTSREPIDVTGETIWTLDPLRLPPDDAGTDRATAPAVALFLQRLAAAAPTLAVDDQVLDRAVHICVALDGLPLPIELAAARVRSHTLDDIATQVFADPGRLGRLGRGADDHRRTVQSAIEWSHRMLTVPEQVAHRRIAVLPGPFTSAMAAAVLGEEVDGPAGADDLLAQLVHRSMLSAQSARRSQGSTTFRQLATVRAHAHHALLDAREEAEITDRRDAWTAALVAARPRLGHPDEIEWFHTLDDGYATVRATLTRRLIDEPDVRGAHIAVRLGTYWYYRARVLEGTRWLQLAHDVVHDRAPDGGQDGRPVDSVSVRLALAAALALRARIDLARPHVEHALDDLPSVAREDLVEVGEGLARLISSAFVPAAWLPAAVELIAVVHERLRRVVDDAGDPDLELVAAAVGCSAAFAAGRWQEAVRDSERVHERASAAGNVMATWVSAAPPMLVAMLTADPDKGIPWFRRLVRGYARLGTGGVGSPLEVRANFAAQAGDYRRAATIYAAARAENRRAALSWPRWELTHSLEEITRERLPRAEYEQARQDGERLSVAEVLAAE
ncbi:BTAD domain-containing putative transcriptional regulator [Actinomycetospora rhizophila]|uniref:BTAD domain-containing putative transcriptional regulator n=1 Tax=Actinomycetospora rhizophila TaxID=1416876 RepID=A0ABV9ZDK0_9PSEU